MEATPMMSDTAHSHTPANRLFYTVWIVLLVLTAVEVWLAYEHLFTTAVMLLILMVLSLVKAALIMAYFMHLRFEKRSLVLSLIPFACIVIALLAVFFPDGMRALELGTVHP
jgi:cytochrome c oxidase subunit IV